MDFKDGLVSLDDPDVASQSEAVSNSENNSQDEPVSLDEANIVSQSEAISISENDSKDDPVSLDDTSIVPQPEAVSNSENNSKNDPAPLDDIGVLPQPEGVSNFKNNSKDNPPSLDDTDVPQLEAVKNSENNSKNDPLSLDDTDVSQPEAISNSENNSEADLVSLDNTGIVSQSEADNSKNQDNIKSCIEEENVSEKDKDSDQPQINEDIPELQDETEKETVVISEKHSTISNVEVIDSIACLETIEKDKNMEVDVALSENDNEMVTAEGQSSTVENVHKENVLVHVNVETTELDASDSKTDKCDTELPSALEDSCKVPDDVVNDETINDNVADESETLAKEKKKDCDVADESSSNADDVQKEAAPSKKLDSESSDSNLDNPEKDLSIEKSIEPENTEFVQFSNDKHDDSQIEVPSVDAEDPFGGEDALTSESVEQLETDSLAEDELREQGDNLQEAVNARNNDSNEKLDVSNVSNADVDKILSNITETSNDVRNLINSLDNTSSINTNPSGADISETGAKDASFAKLSEKQDEQKKDAEKVTPMETEADILPGQDDELCIIPDSMKVIIPNKSGKTTDNDQDKSTSVTDLKCEETMQKSSSELETDTSQSEPKLDTIKSEDKPESATKQKATIQDEQSAKENLSVATDVINIDDEKNMEVEEISSKQVCKQCGEERACKIQVKIETKNYFVCSKTCKALLKAASNKAINIPNESINFKPEKRCAACLLIIEANDERNLSWETMEFCNEECLGKFQRKYGSLCKNCNGAVQAVSLGKYCVRFGCDVRQFCCSTCLEEFKKGLKVCSYCQKDISFSMEGFLAPVGEKGQFKDFCTQDCMEKYSKLNSTAPPATEKKPCSVCKEEKLVHCEVQIYNSNPVAICSEPCFAAFKFVKQVKPEQCSTCKKFFELPNKQHFIVFYENEPHTFCNKTCLNIFIITNRKIVPCNWCKVKKYNFDMIKKELKTGQTLMMCSLNCLTLYQVSINAVSAKRINCDLCKEYSLAHYHLTMSDATIRNFCSYNCVMNFQAQYTKSPITIPTSDDPVPTGLPKRTTLTQRSTNQIASNEMQSKKTLPVISSVTSLATIGNGQASPTSQQSNMIIPANASQTIYKQQVITRPSSPVKVHNRMTQCKPIVHTKGVSVRPHPCTKSTQTTEKPQQVIVPIPVPIYVPFPMHMYSMPFPVPMPFPLPIPVPLFIPTTRNSAKGIMKDIKRIQEKIPADPYEAELLMMAEMVATEKKANDSDSDSVDDSPEAVDTSNTFGDDMLQMALKMATGELDEPAVDLEAALTPNTITATQQAPPQPENTLDNDVQSDRLIIASRGRKRVMPYKPRSTPNKRMRRVSGTNDMPLMPPPEPQPPPQPRIMEPMEKPDANMALKYTFGVNAWRQWVIGKNAELEKQITPMKKIKLFKTDLLQLTADELNYSLCLFVKEVRKPNGAEYAPDTIYYLCLGIQQYLFENNRIDNIFTDSYYEKFTDCLNEVAKKFSVLYNEAQYIVTRVEEEHLWECKQLGAHSPHVLLSTLMFFNTKHFNLVTVEEHMQLSFSHIMKHWKRNPAAQPTAVAGKVPGSRNVLLRFYPPQSALEANSRKKKVYEQQENEENPLRCPVKLYEFYLSKCPESVKTRNDVFYLLPERSCVPDSPVWYSTSPLAKEQLIKMLYRIKMVKEINVALLTI
ncbi:zinc finger MYM-type protein 3 isoform X3 [Monomorium pharaonis]|uniref:zinc finger MYM-type protein 3 isoform X3 n=1 Tax=Monomorium pharaonis TaxID=307658 RepID=UPI00063F15C3|nr:zinc finger MYM-type protein 3 isoform X3 [Monomorium pharaonis]